MVRHNNVGGNSGRVGTDSNSVDSMKDKLIMALIAVIFGGGTTIGYQTLNPESIRPNPWTSIDATKSRIEIEHEFREQISAMATRIDRDLFEIRETQRQIVDSMNTHAGQGAHKVADSRITRCERDIEGIKEKCGE